MSKDKTIPINDKHSIVVLNVGQASEYVPMYRRGSNWYYYREDGNAVWFADRDAAHLYIQAREASEKLLDEAVR